MDQRTSRVDEHSRYYNQIAGSNPERLGALSDGIFAVSMTLLVLALAVPTAAGRGPAWWCARMISRPVRAPWRWAPR